MILAKVFPCCAKFLKCSGLIFIVPVKGWHTRYQGTGVRDNTPRFRKITGNGLENRSVPKLGYQVVQSTRFSVLIIVCIIVTYRGAEL